MLYSHFSRFPELMRDL